MMMQVCEAFSTRFWHAAAWVISEKIIHGHLKVHKMFKVKTSSLHYYECRDQNPINPYVSRVSSHVTSFGTLLKWRVLTTSRCSKTPIFWYVPNSQVCVFLIENSWICLHCRMCKVNVGCFSGTPGKDLFGKATGNEKKSKFKCIYASGEVDNRV